MAYPNLAAEMTRFDVTQKDVAAAIGKKPETVSRWMTGKNSMPVSMAMQIRDKFFPGVSVDYLCDPNPRLIAAAVNEVA